MSPSPLSSRERRLRLLPRLSCRLLLLLYYQRTTMMDCRYAGNEYLLRPPLPSAISAGFLARLTDLLTDISSPELQ